MKTIFFECLNAVSVCASEGQYYCKWDLFSGCENYVGHRRYCFVCWINDTYFCYDFEEIKYQPVKLFMLATELFEDNRLCYGFNKSLNFSSEDYKYKWSDISTGVMNGIYLKDSDFF